ncbi:MAG: 3-hydroxyacyl-CoA dehydrogenase NAD-binding domain-containing protein [Solirubrobacterales bacterium]
MTVSRLGVCGAGTMGAGIAQLGCLGGFETFLYDPDPEALERGAERLRSDLARGEERGRWSGADAAAARLVPAPEVEELAGCELVIEAAPEDLGLKRELFALLEAVCAPGAVLATNTSSLSVTAIAAGTERPERVCGMHFFNPPALMRLVEVVAGDATAPQALAAATDVADRMGRTAVRAADGIGFLANRGARPFSLEALRLLGERVAEPDQIDRIVRLGGGYRMGPFELMDLIGIDVNLEVAKSFYAQSFGEPRWRPHPLQQRMVDAGRLGRKSGRGWYEYGDGPHRPDDPPPAPEPAGPAERDAAIEASVRWVALPDLERARVVEIGLPAGGRPEDLSAAGRYFAAMGKHVECTPGDAPGLVLGRIVCQLVNEACFAVGEGVGTPEDLDTALRLGFNHPRGPFEWLAQIGAERVLDVLDSLRAELGEERYRAAPYLRRLAERPGGRGPV